MSISSNISIDTVAISCVKVVSIRSTRILPTTNQLQCQGIVRYRNGLYARFANSLESLSREFINDRTDHRGVVGHRT